MPNLSEATDDELLSLQQLVLAELNKRTSEAAKRVAEASKHLSKLKLAQGGAAPRVRATRSDKGKPKTPRALAPVAPNWREGSEPNTLESVLVSEDFSERSVVHAENGAEDVRYE